MTTLEKIKNTLSLFSGKLKKLEKDETIGFLEYVRRADDLNIECLRCIRNIIEIDERNGGNNK